MDDGLDAAHRRRERRHIEEIALGELDACLAQYGGTLLVTYRSD